jgi:hypothetical protein
MIELVHDYRKRAHDPKIETRGVDPAMSISPEGAGIGISKRDKVFISYSHKDYNAFEQLKTMLAPVVRSGKIEAWDDTKIAPGAKWKDEIRSALEAAKVAVLLVSENFLASDFIDKHELPPLLTAAQDNGVIVFWIYLRPCLYQETEIAAYQAAHDVGKALSQLSRPKRQQVLSQICAKLVQVAQSP